MHWDVPSGPNGSSVYCNGKLLTKFESRTSAGSSKMTFGDLNPQGISGAGFNGDIALFLIYRNRMDERSINLHHKVCCENWYKI